MKIDLSKLDQDSLSFSRDLELTAEDLENPVVDAGMQVHLEGSVRPLEEGYLVKGWFSCSGEPLCSRCLEPVAWQTREEYVLEYRNVGEIAGQEEVSLDEADLDVGFIEDESIDLRAMAIERVELALPIRIVCNEQCAGLCPTCGGNRNLEDGCRCQEEVDPRWQALQGLKGRTE